MPNAQREGYASRRSTSKLTSKPTRLLVRCQYSSGIELYLANYIIGVILMPRMTKTQQKRLVRDIEAKTKKLFMAGPSNAGIMSAKVTVKDVETISRLCAKWMKQIG